MSVDAILQAASSGHLQGRHDLDATRYDLAAAFGVLGLNRGAEIGVERGVFSEVLLEQNPALYLLCVDAWSVYKGYREHVTASKVDSLYADARVRLAPFYGRCAVIRKFSAEAAADVPDRSLDFVYIDAAHDLPNVIADLHSWSPKVRKGGVVAGHDFRKSKGDRPFHVPQALTAWTSAYRIEPWFILRGDTAPSWFWVVA